MTIDVPNILKAIGPAASIIFAAWIFMGFLQQRYDAAVDRYREVVAQFRDGDMGADRRDNIRDQIAAYKHRCELMSAALQLGLVAAVLLILTLIAGELAIIFPGVAMAGYVSVGSSLLGFSLVIGAALIVVRESRITFRQIAVEVVDVPMLASSTGQRPGSVAKAPDRR